MTEKKKRTPQECQYCHKFYGNLKNHIAMKHKDQDQDQGPLELTREDLLRQRQKEKPEKAVYTCNGCGAEVKKGENPCWQCGETLVWDGIE